MAFHKSVEKALATLRTEHGGTPLVAFGQTVFWDEPTKCVLLPMLAEHYPEARLLAGPHDADYFGRCPAANRSERFVIREHNDGPTRDMWASVGEVAALFGAEKVPTRARLTAAGVDLNRLEHSRYNRLVDSRTSALRWRAVVEAGAAKSVFRDIAVDDVLPQLKEVLGWALDETVSSIRCPRPPQHRVMADALLATLDRLARQPDHAALWQVYRDLWPWFCEQLLGTAPEQLDLTSTYEVFRFNRETYARKRFTLLRHFLDPETGPACRRAYSDAVAGSGIYDLDRFGDEALPFELVMPGRGRGTLSVAPGHVIVHTDPPTVVDVPAEVTTVEALAEAIEGHFGPDVALIGKAVALAYMITSEFVFVLNEHGSPYSKRTRKMARGMREAGIDVALHPILRIKYRTWKSLGKTSVVLRLPEELEHAFRRKVISGAEFADEWRKVVRAQKRLLKSLRRTQSPQDLMELLHTDDYPEWGDKLRAYLQAQRTLLDVQMQVSDMKQDADDLRDQVKRLKAEVDALQKNRGKTSRTLKTLQAEIKRLEKADAPPNETAAAKRALECRREEVAAVDNKLDAVREEIERLENERTGVVSNYRDLETGEEPRAARRLLKKTETEAEAARLQLASRAIRVSENLPYTNARPTAWWFPVVDPAGAWFDAVVDSAELSVEEMV